MTINVQNLTEAGYPLTLTHSSHNAYRYCLRAAGEPVISFADAGHAVRTLAAAEDLRIQTDGNGTRVFRLGEFMTRSEYYAVTAITDALHALADETRQDPVERFIVDPDDYDCDEDNLDDVEPVHEGDTDVNVWEDADGIHVATSAGSLPLDVPQALDVVTLLSAALNSTLRRPWSDDDQSTILSRGTRKVA
ncbi:hypothetical protein [Corynebacterium variabile]|uniref:hypothetical protein n=1 Tax=Corynebacterium variabile TaxID=1727 RepID=UPI003F8EC09B